MPDISHKDAGFIVLVAVMLLGVLIFLFISRFGRYMDAKEPKNLRTLFEKTKVNHEESKFDRALTSLLTYLKLVEENPMQHHELGPVFALIAKTYLRMNEPAPAFYYTQICEHYYNLFGVVAYENNEESTLIGNLRVENEKIQTQAGLILPSERHSEINNQISAHQVNGDIRGPADWIRMQSVSTHA